MGGDEAHRDIALAGLRQKYPGSVDGAVAASAPVLAFKGQTPVYDSESFWAVR